MLFNLGLYYVVLCQIKPDTKSVYILQNILTSMYITLSVYWVIKNRTKKEIKTMYITQSFDSLIDDDHKNDHNVIKSFNFQHKYMLKLSFYYDTIIQCV